MADPTVADYRAKLINGISWRRAFQVTLRNPLGGPATVAFDEEAATQFAGVTTAAPVDLLHTVVDLSQSIPLYDPTTGLPTGGTMPQLAVYVALYSLYRQLAAVRDAAEIPPVTP